MYPLTKVVWAINQDFSLAECRWLPVGEPVGLPGFQEYFEGCFVTRSDICGKRTLPSHRPRPGRPILQAPSLGTSMVVKGEVSGTQDLFVSGRIEGRVSIPGHHLTVKREGRLKAEVVARSIWIEGVVEGIFEAEEKIHLTEAGEVQGKLTAPKVVLEAGCRFRGGINMVEVIRPPSE